ncbi:MAG: nucleotidyltransferase domain-containing protein [Tannerella sp.]|jgi:predicted nucleotidyltransferase|nr:nucleotidyltransferase domain-containing protein [Tannerella sp.]
MVQTANIVTALRYYFQTESRVRHAWMFGSFARGDYRPDSDVDVMIEMKTDKRYTLFDLFDIQYRLEQLLNRKVDIVEKDFIKPSARTNAIQNVTVII